MLEIANQRLCRAADRESLRASQRHGAVTGACGEPGALCAFSTDSCGGCLQVTMLLVANGRVMPIHSAFYGKFAWIIGLILGTITAQVRSALCVLAVCLTRIVRWVQAHLFRTIAERSVVLSREVRKA